MKRAILILLLFFWFIHFDANCQIVKVTTTEDSYNILREYFQHHIRYPAMARENEMAGEVIVSFIIGKDQTLNDIKLVKGLFAVCDTEVIQRIRDYVDY